VLAYTNIPVSVYISLFLFFSFHPFQMTFGDVVKEVGMSLLNCLLPFQRPLYLMHADMLGHYFIVKASMKLNIHCFLAGGAF